MPDDRTGVSLIRGADGDMKREMHEIKLAGRGGQGIVTAGDLLGRAAVLEGKFAQSIPTFGPERRGALSSCTLRISEAEILLKCSSTRPHVLLVLDPTIWHHFNVLLGLESGGTMVFNTASSPEEVQAELAEGKHGYGPPEVRRDSKRSRTPCGSNRASFCSRTDSAQALRSSRYASTSERRWSWWSEWRGGEQHGRSGHGAPAARPAVGVKGQGVQRSRRA